MIVTKPRPKEEKTKVKCPRCHKKVKAFKGLYSRLRCHRCGWSNG